jgi:predicted ATPase/DNA-binding XRE family transcriptional regulator
MPATISLETFTTFGALLRFLRRRSSLTQEALGRAVGYTGAHIGRLEKNERLPDLDTLAARFSEPLLLDNEPQTVARLLALAGAARGAAGVAPNRPDLAAPRPEAAAGGNLPPALTSFVGRESELAEAQRVLAHARLLTIAGAGGSGKTRLALELASRLEGQFADGVWLVELAPLADQALVASAAAAALGVPVRASQSPVEAIPNYLRFRQVLLIFDNCEHVIGAAAALAEAVLLAGPRVTLVATSREPLRAGGEVVYRLRPLSLPQQRAASLEALAESEAARLFVERARGAWPGFELTDANASAVAEICRCVDGLPLALELAAARISTLSAEELAARLAEQGGLSLLAGGRRTAHSRQTTLTALLEWSYVLLTPSERRLLRQLAVLPGSWTLATAEALGDVDVVNDLSQLVDKSLVSAEEAGESRRYRLLEPTRQFAGQKLDEAGNMAAMRNRHLEYWASWTEAAEVRLEGPLQAEWLERISVEHHHLRAAMGWALEPGADFEAGLRLAAAALGHFTLMRGHLREGLDWARAMLGSSTGAANRRARARLLGRAAQIAYFRFENDLGLAWSRAGAALCRELDDPRGLAEALWAEGVILASQQAYPAAEAALEACVAIGRAKRAGAYWLSAALVSLGRVLDYVPAADGRQHIEEGLALAAREQNAWGIARALWALGDSLGEKRAYAEARPAYERCLKLAEQLGDPFTRAAALQSLALVTHMLGDYGLSGRYAAEAASLYRDLGDEVQEPFVLRLQGYAALHASDWDLARQLVAGSVSGNRAIGHRLGQAAALVGMGSLALAQGDLLRAARLGGCAEACAEVSGLLPPDASALRELAVKVGADPAWAFGRSLTLEQGVAIALDEN